MEPGRRVEPDGQGGATVLLDGHPQSHVDLTDPTHLAFEYVAHLAAAVDALTTGPLRATHVGGAGLTLPRWLAHTRPGSPQVVLEPDEALTDLVRRELPLPRGHRIRVRAVDGRSGMRALKDGSADLVVVDAYAAGQVPPELSTAAFLADCARVLAPGGLFLMNVADEPGLRWVARVAAGVRRALPHVALVALAEVLKGRRFGNGVLVASRHPLDVDELRRHLARQPMPAGVLGERELARRTGGARPFTEEDAQPSPEPPDPGAWRVR